jgi:hypothetical protein
MLISAGKAIDAIKASWAGEPSMYMTFEVLTCLYCPTGLPCVRKLFRYHISPLTSYHNSPLLPSPSSSVWFSSYDACQLSDNLFVTVALTSNYPDQAWSHIYCHLAKSLMKLHNIGCKSRNLSTHIFINYCHPASVPYAAQPIVLISTSDQFEGIWGAAENRKDSDAK